MTPIILQPKGSFYYGSQKQLPEATLTDLIARISNSANRQHMPLAGRGQMLRTALDAIGPVIIKPYRRGGLIRHFNRCWYLRFRKTRGEQEYDWYCQARSIGVQSPEPVGFVYRGRRLYQAWLVTRAIDPHQTLAQLALLDNLKTLGLMPAVAAQVDRLIRNCIHHVDLHPGNVIVDAANRIYLIDFDKARLCKQGPARLTQYYLKRWSRAVTKHGLPQALSQAFASALNALP